MRIKYKLEINKEKPSLITTLINSLNENKSTGEIKILSEDTDNKSYFIASFMFHKWKRLALKKSKMEHIGANISKLSKKSENIIIRVRSKIKEASEAEAIASNIIIDVDANQLKIVFITREIKINNINQIVQVGIYLQQKMKYLFISLQVNGQFPVMKILEA